MAQRYTFFINLACKLRNNSSNLAYGPFMDFSWTSLGKPYLQSHEFAMLEVTLT